MSNVRDDLPKLPLPYLLNKQQRDDLLHLIEGELARSHYRILTEWRKRLTELKDKFR